MLGEPFSAYYNSCKHKTQSSTIILNQSINATLSSSLLPISLFQFTCKLGRALYIFSGFINQFFTKPSLSVIWTPPYHLFILYQCKDDLNVCYVHFPVLIFLDNASLRLRLSLLDPYKANFSPLGFQFEYNTEEMLSLTI